MGTKRQVHIKNGWWVMYDDDYIAYDYACLYIFYPFYCPLSIMAFVGLRN